MDTQCTYCNKIFDTFGGLKKHLTTIDPLKCAGHNDQSYINNVDKENERCKKNTISLNKTQNYKFKILYFKDSNEICFCCGENVKGIHPINKKGLKNVPENGTHPINIKGRDKTDKDKLKDNIFDDLRPICNKCDNYKPSGIGDMIWNDYKKKNNYPTENSIKIKLDEYIEERNKKSMKKYGCIHEYGDISSSDSEKGNSPYTVDSYQSGYSSDSTDSYSKVSDFNSRSKRY